MLDTTSLLEMVTIREGIRAGLNEVDTQGALDRLAESIHAYPSRPIAPDDDHNPTASQHDAAALYNAHSLAAHRSSVAAFMGRGGNSQASHQVAADHHNLAAKSADAGAKLHNPNSEKNKDFKTAATYHRAQSSAHMAMASTNARGNQQPSSYETSISTGSAY